MPEPSIRIKKIWEDVDFFEVNFEFKGISCTVTLDIYTSNDDLSELREGLKEFINLQHNEFTWTSGIDNENTTHFLSLRFFFLNKTGTIGIEIIADNKVEKPYWIRSNFFILTELGQIDDLDKKIKQLIKEEIAEFESVIPITC